VAKEASSTFCMFRGVRAEGEECASSRTRAVCARRAGEEKHEGRQRDKRDLRWEDAARGLRQEKVARA
jgi:hypothetical protein